jgi:hypothetical protein
MTAMCWDVGCQQQQLAMAITATCMLNGVHHNALRVFIRFSNEFSNSASEGFYSVRLMHASCVSAHTTAHIPKYAVWSTLGLSSSILRDLGIVLNPKP